MSRGREGLAERTSSLLVDRSATHDSEKNGGFGVLLGRDLREVIGKNDEVGVLAWFELAFLPFLELCISGSRSVGADAIFQRNLFLPLPTASRTAFREFTRHAGVEAAHRIDGFHGVIRSEGQADSALL